VNGALVDIVLGVMLLLGVVYTARVSKGAAVQQNVAQGKANAADEWDDLVSQLRTEVDRLRPRVESLEKDRTEDRRAIDRLTRRLDDSVRRYRAAVRYIIELQRFIARHLPDGPDAPPPPRDLSLDAE